ncbi:MAG: pyrroline-5-carboxylate reductase [Abditibacteriota bacterium]|nr:pyrroline-5-carboxylate reductase [Abditibacteriota bacterium]
MTGEITNYSKLAREKIHRVLIIGAGYMGSGLARGIISAGLPVSLTVSDIDPKRLEYIAGFAEENGSSVNTTTDTLSAAGPSDVIILAVKPAVIGGVLAQIAPATKDKLLISIAAGVTLASIEAQAPEAYTVRAMPNICVQIQEGVLAYATGSRSLTGNQTELTEGLLGAVGVCIRVSESQLDAVTGLSGSGPAFVFMMIEALSDGGVYSGLPRSVATQLAAQTVLGSAKMVLTSGMHPDQLKDMVTSPAGTTIEGVAVLEKAGIRSAFMNAVKAASDRSTDLGR